jgi:steroid delta-isomerase-like uncharacterized protein
MSTSENKNIVRQMFEAISRQDLDSMDDLMANDFVLHIHEQLLQGWESGKQFLRDEFIAFPDLSIEIEEMVAEGDLVCVRVRETATHDGPYRGLASTGRKLSYTVVAFWRLDNQKIAEGWTVFDRLNFFEQLGVISSPDFPGEG